MRKRGNEDVLCGICSASVASIIFLKTTGTHPEGSSLTRATIISMEVHIHGIRDGVPKIRATLLHKGESLFKMKFVMVS